MTFRARHLLGVEPLAPVEITTLLDLAETYVALNRRTVKHGDALEGLTQINLFFENSTRTQSSFELAGKRLGADVMNMAVAHSSVKKGETLIDTALTLNAMQPDLLVVRHPSSGAANLLASKVNCAVLNAGDGRHEHPTQALLDALTIRRAKGRLHRLTVAICGDIAHSRVARSNLILLGKMESRVRLVGPATLMPAGARARATGLPQAHPRTRLAQRCITLPLWRSLHRFRSCTSLVGSTRLRGHRGRAAGPCTIRCRRCGLARGRCSRSCLRRGGRWLLLPRGDRSSFRSGFRSCCSLAPPASLRSPGS